MTMLLADAVRVAVGKLYILGGGWSITGPEPVPMAIAIKFDVPWHEAGRDHEWELSLLDADGRPVLCAAHDEHPVRHAGSFHAHRPRGARPGISLDVPLAVDLGTVTVPPGGRYVWKLTVDGVGQESWQVAFTCRPTPAAPAAE